MRLLYRHHFKTPMRSTVLYIATVLLLIGASVQSTTEKIETIVEEVQADVKELKQDLEHAESKDPQKLEIYKQIRRLNPDGSYTVGYESDDGSFKIESRDVQGNVKGTYGYIDANGEIKRVSYIASNSTGNKKQNDELQTAPIVKPNRVQYVTSTTKRPYLSSTTSSPNRQSVIQTIPRKRLLSQYNLDKLTQSSTATTPVAQQSNSFYVTSKYPENSPVTDSTTTVIYATSAPTSKSSIHVHPTQISSGSGRNLDQIIRPDRQDSDSSRKVQIVTARDSSSTTKPVVEIENENEKVSIRGNNYRRQYDPTEKLFEREPEATTASQQQIIYSHVDDGEGSSVYGGSTSGKPLYTSTSTSRIPAIVIAARQRANQIQQAINNGQTTVATTVRTPEKHYVKTQRNQDINKSSIEQSTESTSEQNFLTQTSHPIVQIPPNRGGQQPENDEPIIYRRRPIPPQNFQQYPIREHIRGVPNQNVVRNSNGREPPTNINERSEQYLRESNLPPPSEGLETGPQNFPDENLIIPPNLPPFRGQRKPYDQRKYVTQEEQDSEYDQQYFPNPVYNRFNPGYDDILNRPLTTLDFERLLHYLVLRHQQVQQQAARLGYYPQYRSGLPLSNFGQYSPYQQIPRPPIIDPAFYDPRAPYYRPSNQVRQYNDPESAYQAQNQIPEQAAQYRRKPANYYPTRYFTDTTGSYTKNDEQYEEAQPGNDDSDLPSNVREELLYRMLMLAIRGEPPNLISTPQNKDLNPTNSLSGARGQYTKKPVRSVQILSED